jgi:hypothetical protein
MITAMAIGMLPCCNIRKSLPKLSKDLSESFDLCQNNRCILAVYEKRDPCARASFNHLVGAQ